LSHIPVFDAKFLTGLAAIDAGHAEAVRLRGCPVCEAVLDRGDYPRKPRGELGQAEHAFTKRHSFCCRGVGGRMRARRAALRFLGRKVYVAFVVILASAAARATTMVGRGRPPRVHGVPARTVLRWLSWWQTTFALGKFWMEAKARFAAPVDVATLPTSLFERFGAATAAAAAAVEKMLRFIAPVTTTSVATRISMVL
jgi:hypothetical protein